MSQHRAKSEPRSNETRRRIPPETPLAPCQGRVPRRDGRQAGCRARAELTVRAEELRARLATMMAADMANSGYAVEIWDHKRLVARLPANAPKVK
jgi:hypothetical protein